MNAFFRKGKRYKVLNGKFQGIEMEYIGFDRKLKKYHFREGYASHQIEWLLKRSYAILKQLNHEQKPKEV